MARRALTGGCARAAAGGLAALLPMLLWACGDTPPASGAAGLERLAETGRVTVHSQWRPPDPAAIERGLPPIFTRGFEQPAESDGAVSPLRAVPGSAAPQVSRSPHAAARGTSGMRFETASGALLWWLSVRPDTSYLARVRARRPAESSGALPPRAGELTVVEFLRPETGRLPPGRTLAELEPLLGKPIAEHRVAPPTDGSYGESRLRFTTSGRTTSVLVMLFGGVPADLAAMIPATAPRTDGAIDFDDLALYELPLARVLPTPSAELRRTGNDFERDVTLGGETRTAFMAPPPGEVRIPVTLPAGRFRLHFGYGVAEESRQSAARQPVRFTARFESADATTAITLPREELAPRLRPDDAGWHDVAYAGSGRGEEATLVLTTSAPDRRSTEDLAAFSLPCFLPDSRPVGAPPNVVLLSIDTLRPDRLGAYGARREDGLAQSPAIDAFAAGAVVFEEARAQSPYTLPSHATLLTGLHPAVHGVESFDSTLAPAACVRLIDRFRDRGYRTAAFTGGGFLGPIYGLWHGFDRWSVLDPFLHEQEPMRQLLPHPGEPLLNAACWRRTGHGELRTWLETHRATPFFLFLHTYAVHNYRPPAEFCRRFRVSEDPEKFDPLAHSDERTPAAADLPDLRARYDASIAAVDAELGRFLDLLRELDLERDTLVVLLSDHGEEFLEHGGFGHGRTLYDEVLRIPLIMRGPGIAPRRDRTPVTLADVGPTLLSLCGLPGLPGAGGRPLLPEPADATSPFSARVRELHLGELRALQLNGLKLIEMERFSPIRPRLPDLALFALPNDPFERKNLSALAPDGSALPDAQQPEGLPALRRLLDDHFRDLERLRLPDATLPGGLRSPDLDALGY
jgi:arylsulfatase A-like enzyme